MAIQDVPGYGDLATQLQGWLVDQVNAGNLNEAGLQGLLAGHTNFDNWLDYRGYTGPRPSSSASPKTNNQFPNYGLTTAAPTTTPPPTTTPTKPTPVGPHPRTELSTAALRRELNRAGVTNVDGIIAELTSSGALQDALTRFDGHITRTVRDLIGDDPTETREKYSVVPSTPDPDPPTSGLDKLPPPPPPTLPLTVAPEYIPAGRDLAGAMASLSPEDQAFMQEQYKFAQAPGGKVGMESFMQGFLADPQGYTQSLRDIRGLPSKPPGGTLRPPPGDFQDNPLNKLFPDAVAGEFDFSLLDPNNPNSPLYEAPPAPGDGEKPKPWMLPPFNGDYDAWLISVGGGKPPGGLIDAKPIVVPPPVVEPDPIVAPDAVTGAPIKGVSTPIKEGTTHPDAFQPVKPDGLEAPVDPITKEILQIGGGDPTGGTGPTATPYLTPTGVPTGAPTTTVTPFGGTPPPTIITSPIPGGDPTSSDSSETSIDLGGDTKVDLTNTGDLDPLDQLGGAGGFNDPTGGPGGGGTLPLDSTLKDTDLKIPDMEGGQPWDDPPYYGDYEAWGRDWQAGIISGPTPAGKISMGDGQAPSGANFPVNPSTGKPFNSLAEWTAYNAGAGNFAHQQPPTNEIMPPYAPWWVGGGPGDAGHPDNPDFQSPQTMHLTTLKNLYTKLSAASSDEERNSLVQSILSLGNLPSQAIAEGQIPGAFGNIQDLYNLGRANLTSEYELPNAPNLDPSGFYEGGVPASKWNQYMMDQIDRTQIPIENLRDLTGSTADYMESRTGDLVNPYRGDVDEMFRKERINLEESLSARNMLNSTQADEARRDLDGAHKRAMADADLKFYQGVGPERRADIGLVGDLLSQLFSQQMGGSQFALDKMGALGGAVGQGEAMDVQRRGGEMDRQQADFTNLLQQMLTQENVGQTRMTQTMQPLSMLLSALAGVNVAPGTVGPLQMPMQRAPGPGAGELFGNLLGSLIGAGGQVGAGYMQRT